MIFLNGKIHLFTKEWNSKSVSHYIIDPTTEALQPAQRTESYQSDFVVTDATYFQGKLYLIGYTKGANVYLLSCEETEPGVFFSGKIQKYFLGMATRFGQIEGLPLQKKVCIFRVSNSDLKSLMPDNDYISYHLKNLIDYICVSKI
jgi:hypothetical protein